MTPNFTDVRGENSIVIVNEVHGQANEAEQALIRAESTRDQARIVEQDFPFRFCDLCKRRVLSEGELISSTSLSCGDDEVFCMCSSIAQENITSENSATECIEDRVRVIEEDVLLTF